VFLVDLEKICRAIEAGAFSDLIEETNQMAVRQGFEPWVQV
jgi:hypothetical protein